MSREQKTIKYLDELRAHYNNDRELAKDVGISRSTLYKRLEDRRLKHTEIYAVMALYNRVFDKNVGRGNRCKTLMQLSAKEKDSILSEFLTRQNNNITEIAKEHNVSYYTANKIIDEYFKKD